ncbi:MAG: hypothetical protein KJ000_22305 [Pirellulaceae bacterium]|nr:hypothetical protein [Pirellulaceae bacterium]
MKCFDSFALPLVLGCLIATGCVRDDFGPTGTVAGTLRKNGQPLSAGTKVVFMQVDQGYASFGETDAQGKFRITSFNRGELPVGNYQVMIQPASLGVDPDRVSAEDLLDRPQEFQQPSTAHEFDFKYRQTSTSGLAFDVKEGHNEFEIVID